jgi:hypothetical protein
MTSGLVLAAFGGPKGLGNLAQALAWVARPQRL